MQISTDIPERPFIASVSDVKASGTNACMKTVTVAPNAGAKLKEANAPAPVNLEFDRGFPERPMYAPVSHKKDNITNISTHDVNIATDAVSTLPNTDSDKEIETETKVTLAQSNIVNTDIIDTQKKPKIPLIFEAMTPIRQVRITR